MLVKAHGKAKRVGHGTHRVQVAPAKQLPEGIPAPPGPVVERDPQGRLLPGPGARHVAAMGGRARGESLRLKRLLGLSELPEDHPYQPYARLAADFRDHHMRELAEHVGGGQVGSGPASVISTASLQLAASRYLNDLGVENGDAKLLGEASRLADASRQNLLAAHELVAREAKARKARGPVDLGEVFK